ncbi:MAG: ABC transporter permease [Arenicellales bacterium]|jgi:peptide/nickel transport system permease protein|nr:ABC transporter permease [Arenicellales bacterium]|tara:strand:- start:1411 stop:2364 length:954 start_codon:yes stop_codon:yes gene_type:complete
MVKLIARRLALGVLTIVLVSGIIFVGVQALPGDSCTAYLGRAAQGKRLENCRRDFGLERPVLARYIEWTLGAVRGDFGVSLKGKKPISETVGTRFRNTVILGITASILGVPLAILLGIIAALWRDRLPDLWVSTTAIFAMTIPEFVSSTVLILIFSVWLGWLPGIVITRPDAPLFEFLSDIILPIVVLAFVMTAHILRMVRTSVIDVLASDYVQMAQLKGVPYWQMVFKHVLPNALLPTINLVALTIAWLLGGTLVIEVVFNYPGLGRLMVQAIFFRDLAMVQAIALILATLYIALNLFADLLTLVANPRLRTMRSS